MITVKPLSITKPSAAATSVVAAPSAQALESVTKHRNAVFSLSSAADATGTTTYTASFKDYKGQQQNIKFKDSVNSKSAAVVYKKGIGYAGVVRHSFPASFYEGLGMSSGLVKCLDFISKNEGCFESINSYDQAIFSFGFVQFAGGGRSLHTLLALIKYRNPDVFYDSFQRFGIDVEYTFANERFSGQQIVCYVPNPSNGKTILKGQEAELHINENKLLTTVFIRAGYDPEIGKMQVMMFTYEYANKAFAGMITLPIGKIKTIDVVDTEAGITALLDMSVNQGVSGAAKLFQDAYTALAQRKGLTTLAQYKTLSEREVLTEIMNQTQKEIVKKRVKLALDNLPSA